VTCHAGLSLRDARKACGQDKTPLKTLLHSPVYHVMRCDMAEVEITGSVCSTTGC